MSNGTATMRPGERYSRTSEGRMVVRNYLISGADNAYLARNATGLPVIGDQYPDSSKLRVVKVDIEEQLSGMDRVHYATITYERSSAKASEPEIGDEYWTFSTNDTGAHIDNAFVTTRYPADATDTSNLIGAKPDGTVEGLDVQDTSGTLTITKYYDIDAVVSSIGDLDHYLKTVNSGTFKGVFPARTLLFTGYQITPSHDNDDPCPVVFTFEYRPNLTQYEIPDILDINDNPILVTGGMGGHDYIKIQQVEKAGTDKIQIRADVVRVHEVYQTSDFDGLGLAATLIVTDGEVGS